MLLSTPISRILRPTLAQPARRDAARLLHNMSATEKAARTRTSLLLPAKGASFPCSSRPSTASSSFPILSPRRSSRLHRLYSTSIPTAPPLLPFRTHPSPSPSTPLAHTFFHPPTSTWTYVVVHPRTFHCTIIDSTLDFDPSTNTVSTQTADSLLGFIRDKGYTVERILETHAHADHLTAAHYLKKRLASPEKPDGPPVGISSGIRQTQGHFAAVYDIPLDELVEAFDEYYEDGDEVVLGGGAGGEEGIKGKVLSLPGHTACSAAFQFGDYVFVGDTIFLPTLGSARADFPLASPSLLYTSSQRLLSLPPQTRLFSGHHYPSDPEENVCSATVAEQREYNRHLGAEKEESEFVKMREERDRGLKEPGLLHQSLQVNIRGGRLPRGIHGRPYFRLPVFTPDELFLLPVFLALPTNAEKMGADRYIATHSGKEDDFKPATVLGGALSQYVPRKVFFALKRLFPAIYWSQLVKGTWFGPRGPFRPVNYFHSA